MCHYRQRLYSSHCHLSVLVMALSLCAGCLLTICDSLKVIIGLRSLQIRADELEINLILYIRKEDEG